jgi:hypothetical protein
MVGTIDEGFDPSYRLFGDFVSSISSKKVDANSKKSLEEVDLKRNLMTYIKACLSRLEVGYLT